MKFSIKDFFSKCDQIHSFLRIWLHLLKKSLMENFIFFVQCECNPELQLQSFYVINEQKLQNNSSVFQYFSSSVYFELLGYNQFGIQSLFCSFLIMSSTCSKMARPIKDSKRWTLERLITFLRE